MQTILMIAMLLLTPPEREQSPFPAVIMTANQDKLMMWEPGGKILYYPKGVKRKEITK